MSAEGVVRAGPGCACQAGFYHRAPCCIQCRAAHGLASTRSSLQHHHPCPCFTRQKPSCQQPVTRTPCGADGWLWEQSPQPTGNIMSANQLNRRSWCCAAYACDPWQSVGSAGKTHPGVCVPLQDPHWPCSRLSWGCSRHVAAGEASTGTERAACCCGLCCNLHWCCCGLFKK